MKLPKLLALLIAASLSCPASAEVINIAVASNFMAALQDIVGTFEKATGHTVHPTFGSSGTLYTQIRNGAPFQILFSADQEKPMELEQDGLAVPGTRFTYATGTLVLWSAKPDFVDADGKILKAGFDKLAIANPKLAPYGAAAMQVLQHLDLAGTLRGRLVQGENIAQTYQFVESGNADLGFVALSQVMDRDKGGIKTGSAWIVPAALYKPIRQDAVLLKTAAGNKAAQELLGFMRSEKARGLIAAYGYRTEPE